MRRFFHAPMRRGNWQRLFAAIVRRIWALAQKSSRTIQHLIWFLQHPVTILKNSSRLLHAWRTGGLGALKTLLRNLTNEVEYNDIWVNQYLKSFTADGLLLLQQRMCAMRSPPLISVLLRTRNTPTETLRRAIQSVVHQMYPHWELCIADDGSTSPHIRSLLEVMSKADNRIKVVLLPQNANAANALNHAFEMASGEFIALLDQKDLLEPQALFRLAECMVEYAPGMIYSDEAEMTEDGGKINNSIHRPSFSLEYLRSNANILNLVAFRKTLLNEIGGFNASLPRLHLYDLILRAVERAEKIVHIPEILYLRRHSEMADLHLASAEAAQAQHQIVLRHLERCGEAGSVNVGLQSNYLDIRYPIQGDIKVAIIIPTKNHGELVRQCLDSIQLTVKHIDHDIFVIDHESTDELTLKYFEEIERNHKVLRYEGAFNFSKINNWAVSQIKGEYSHYLFLNNDIEATEEGWLERMIELGQMPDVGIVGAKLLYPDRNTIQHAGVCVGMYGIAEHYGKFMQHVQKDGTLNPGYHGTLVVNHEMSAVTAACALMRRDAFESVGGFEEDLAVGFGDVDLCLKTREVGYRILFCAQAVLIHHESYTRGKSRADPHPKDSEYFVKKWRMWLDGGDPYYNPNLTLQSTQWGVKQPALFNLDITNRVWQRTSTVGKRVNEPKPQQCL